MPSNDDTLEALNALPLLEQPPLTEDSPSVQRAADAYMQRMIERLGPPPIVRQAGAERLRRDMRKALNELDEGR